jgi:hypothetical protein
VIITLVSQTLLLVATMTQTYGFHKKKAVQETGHAHLTLSGHGRFALHVLLGLSVTTIQSNSETCMVSGLDWIGTNAMPYKMSKV